jgi:uncharacterized membrane protein YfhO
MIGTKVLSSTGTVRFNFDPMDYKIGAFLSLCGIILIIAIIIKRKEIDEYIAKISEPVLYSKSKNKKRK